MPDKLALIADQDTVLGFGALGMDCRVAENRDDAIAAFEDFLKNSYAIIFVTDEVTDFIEDLMPVYIRKVLIMNIPSCISRKPMGLQELTAIVEKAVGISNIMDKA